jgi:hypothetical protein
MGPRFREDDSSALRWAAKAFSDAKRWWARHRPARSRGPLAFAHPTAGAFLKPSLRGALATKQSSFLFRGGMDCFAQSGARSRARLARNDGKNTRSISRILSQMLNPSTDIKRVRILETLF